MAIVFTITDAGRAALVDADHDGTTALTLSEIGFGRGRYTPSADQTALREPIKRLASMAGQAVAADTLHVSVQDESSDTYAVGEIGLFTDAGVLFAVYSQSEWIIEKAAPSTLLLATDLVVEALDVSAITFGDAAFLNPPATTEVAGVLELATQAEVDAGSDARRGVVPRTLKAFLDKVLAAYATLKQLNDHAASRNHPAATTNAQGMVELATYAETKEGSDNARAVTPAANKSALDAHRTEGGAHAAARISVEGLAKLGNPTTVQNALGALGTAARRDEGPGKGLDADTVDGIHGSQILRNTGDVMNGTLTVNAGILLGAPVSGQTQIRMITDSSRAWFQFYNRDDNNETRTLIFSGYGGASLADDGLQVKHGGNYQKIWHSGNDGAGSGLDADRLDGRDLDMSSTPYSVVQRDNSGDVRTRLFRPEYTSLNTGSGNLRYFWTSRGIGNSAEGADNFLRPTEAGEVRDVMAALGLARKDRTETFGQSIGVGGSAPSGSKSFNNGKAIAIGDEDSGIRSGGDGTIEVWANDRKVWTSTNTHSTSDVDVTLNKSRPWLTLDSPNSGDNALSQGAGLSIGESGQRGDAALHLTYVGDGSGYIGMGAVGDNGIPANAAMRLYYRSKDVTFNGKISGNGAGLSNVDADRLQGLQASQFLRSDTGNNKVPLGSTSPTNWDGLVYDDGANTLAFFADQDISADTPRVLLGPGWVEAGGDRLLKEKDYDRATIKNDSGDYLGISKSGYIDLKVGGDWKFRVTKEGRIDRAEGGIEPRLINVSVGAVGTYAFLKNNDSSAADVGATKPGSKLSYTAAWNDDESRKPSGTWMCMGKINRGAGENANTRSSVWYRIS